MTTQKVQERTEEQKEVISTSAEGADAGQDGRRSFEPIQKFYPSQREKVIMNDDSYIVLGGDRIGTPPSGYAGKGHTGCHMIDLVVGRDAYLNGHPGFKNDAARIYICQKTDSDHSFGLPAGIVGTSKARSSIGIKADGVRIIAREGIKLVTMGKGTTLANGNKTKSFNGIDLIANNDDKFLEPITKAYKLADTLEEFIKAIEDLATMVEKFVKNQAKFNEDVAMHVHPFHGTPSMHSTNFMLPGPAIYASNKIINKMVTESPLSQYRTSMIKLRTNHLTPLTSGWFGSQYNYSN